MEKKTPKKAAKAPSLHGTTGTVTALFTILGLVLFCLSFTTGYYTFGQMNSVLIVGLTVGALVCLAAFLIAVHRAPEALWPHALSFAVIGLLAAAAMLIIGDRVEGIGNCILTDYDSGHGGEEAIYMSLVGSVCLLVGMIYHIIGTFSVKGTAPAGKVRTLVTTVTGGVLAACAIAATLSLTGAFAPKAGPASGVTGGAAQTSSYSISINKDNGNQEMGGTQFLTANMKSIMNADNRFFVDVTLNLDGTGNYTLVSDSYVLEAGKRAVIGDDSGIGLIYKVTAEGTYTDNGDGTVTAAPASHVKLELDTDTYSDQMKQLMNLADFGCEENGTYDSADKPVLLDIVPETTFVLNGSEIVSYGKPAPKGSFAISINKDNGNQEMGGTQFLTANMKSIMNSDNRFFVDVTLNLDGTGNYTLVSDSYVLEAGKRAVIGDDSGIGLIYKVTAEGTYADNGDGTVTTAPASNVTLELDTDTYSDQMKQLMKLGDFGCEENGTYNSADKPALLDIVPETTWTLSGGEIVNYVTAAEEPAAAEAPTEPEASDAQGVTILSDDEGTKMTFFADGSYKFEFESYNIVDEGTYTYTDGILTVTNAKGAEAAAEGDPLKLHYVSAVSDQLTGDYTIPADTFAFGASEAAEVQSVTIVSDDEGTKMVFNSNGTYQFLFESYNIVDEGTYTYADGILTVTDKNGVEHTADGDPMHLHYVYSGSDQLTGDYTIPADTFAFGSSEAAEVQSVTIVSDDEGTKMVFNSNGTYQFLFEAYNIVDEGTYTYADGVLTVTDKNGKESTADGDPMHLHYTYSGSDQLTGDYTIPADTFAFGTSEAAEVQSVTIVSDDEGTKMVFNSNGTYQFLFESYNIVDEGTYTYADGVLTVTNAKGAEATAEGDPLKLHYVSAVSDQLTGDYTIPADTFAFGSSEAAEVQSVTIVSDDEGTKMVFNSNGTYQFLFEAYNIVDEGTYTYADGILTVTDKNGKESIADGDPMHLHYTYSGSDQLTGDYTIPADTFAFGSTEAAEVQGVTIVSNDEGTKMVFNSDGTYQFLFEAYNIVDEGTYTYANGVLTVTNAKGAEATAEGDPLKLHYVSAVSDQLVGDYTISADTFAFGAEPVKSATIVSDDEGTKITFFSDGVYKFEFEAYSVVDEGTYTYVDGVLTLTDVNGMESTADGDPMHLHYVYSGSDMLTGDYTIPAGTFSFE